MFPSNECSGFGVTGSWLRNSSSAYVSTKVIFKQRISQNQFARFIQSILLMRSNYFVDSFYNQQVFRYITRLRNNLKKKLVV